MILHNERLQAQVRALKQEWNEACTATEYWKNQAQQLRQERDEARQALGYAAKRQNELSTLLDKLEVDVADLKRLSYLQRNLIKEGD